MKYVNRKKHYFRKQRLMGLGLVLLCALTALVTEGDLTVALLFGPVGIYLMFTKEMWLTNDYYYECKHYRSVKNRRP